MRTSRASDEQIRRAFQEVEAGVRVKDVIRKLGVSEQTFYRWKKQRSDANVAELQRRLRELEAENETLKELIAQLSLDKRDLQDRLDEQD